MTDEASSLDSFDRQILIVLDEFEYDPLQDRASPGRISPVPLYLIHAATVPLSQRPFDGQCRPMTCPDVHARVEALKTLEAIPEPFVELSV